MNQWLNNDKATYSFNDFFDPVITSKDCSFRIWNPTDFFEDKNSSFEPAGEVNSSDWIDTISQSGQENKSIDVQEIENSYSKQISAEPFQPLARNTATLKNFMNKNNMNKLFSSIFSFSLKSFTEFVNYLKNTKNIIDKNKPTNFQEKDDDFYYLDQQAKLFDSVKKKLLKEYQGKYVLFENGIVIDSGDSRVEVAMRAYQKEGMKTLFIEKVVSEAEPVPSVWTPFLVSK